MFRADRQPRGEDPLLLLKMTLFVVAAAIAVIGMALQLTWVIFGAILLLAVAFLLRFLRPRAAESAVDANPADEPAENAGHAPVGPRS
jgi:hypothetical protein